MTTLQAGAGALVFSGRTAILATKSVRGVATGFVHRAAVAFPYISVAYATASFSAPTVQSSVSAGRKDFKQVR